MEDDGNLLSYEHFCIKYDSNPPILDLLRLRNALPQEFIFLTKDIMTHQFIQPQLPPLSVEGILFLDEKRKNFLLENA